ncbi:MAG TPA: DUF4340 domain-containing protein [Stenomitos sp.]
MKLKSSTIGLLAIAILSTGGLYLWEKSRPEDTGSSGDQAAAKPLFGFKESDIEQVALSTPTQTIKLEKSAKGWQLTAPVKGPADDGTVTFLVNLLATGTSERSLDVAPAELKTFGLDQPKATIDVGLKDKKSHRLLLGSQTFNQSSLYGQVDPGQTSGAKSNVTVQIVPTGFLDAVNRPLAEWRAKPPQKPPASSAQPSAQPSVAPPSPSAPTPAAKPSP